MRRAFAALNSAAALTAIMVLLAASPKTGRAVSNRAG